MANYLHATSSDPFETFDSNAKPAFASDSERGIIWLAAESAQDELWFFGHNIAICEVDSIDETITYTDFDIDGDPMYDTETMALALKSSNAAILRIRKCTLIEHGDPTTVVAVRDPSRVKILKWLET